MTYYRLDIHATRRKYSGKEPCIREYRVLKSYPAAVSRTIATLLDGLGSMDIKFEVIDQHRRLVLDGRRVIGTLVELPDDGAQVLNMDNYRRQRVAAA